MTTLIKRFNCTVSDRRGFEGDCIEANAAGKFVKFTSHENIVFSLEKIIQRLKVVINEREKAIDDQAEKIIKAAMTGYVDGCKISLGVSYSQAVSHSAAYGYGAKLRRESRCDHDWEDVGSYYQCTYPECQKKQVKKTNDLSSKDDLLLDESSEEKINKLEEGSKF